MSAWWGAVSRIATLGAGQDAGDIISGILKRRYAMVFFDRTRTSVVGSQREFHQFTLLGSQLCYLFLQLRHVLALGFDRGDRIRRVQIVLGSGFWHELGDALRSRRARGVGIPP